MASDCSLVGALNSHFYPKGQPTAVMGWDEEHCVYINVVDPIILAVVLVKFVDGSWERQAFEYNTETEALNLLPLGKVGYR